MKQFTIFWEWFSVHIWLLFSSYGIMFAILSFFDEIGQLQNISPVTKGILSFCLGCIFYLLVGIPHIKGANNINQNIKNKITIETMV